MRYEPAAPWGSGTSNCTTTGKWSLEGGKVCFVYPKEDKECYAVEVSGDDVSFTDKSGSGMRMKLLKGNPKNL